MKKKFYTSMTFWGTVLLSLEAALKVAGGSYPTLEPFVVCLGVFLTAFGFRRSINEK